MPIPLLPIVAVVLVSTTAIIIKKKGPKLINDTAAHTQKSLVTRRLSARCRSIFQEYVQYAAINILLMLFPIFLTRIGRLSFDGIELLAAGYVIVLCRMLYASSAICILVLKYKTSFKNCKTLTDIFKNLLQDLILEEVEEEARQSRVKRFALNILGKRMFSRAIVDGNIETFRKELRNLSFRIMVAFTIYVCIAHFASTPLMTNCAEMPFWKSCLYPFFHSVEISWNVMSSNDFSTLVIAITGLLLFTETISKVATITHKYGFLPASLLAFFISVFSYALLSKTSFHGLHVFIYFQTYMFFVKAYLDHKACIGG